MSRFCDREFEPDVSIITRMSPGGPGQRGSVDAEEVAMLDMRRPTAGQWSRVRLPLLGPTLHPFS